MNRGKIMQSNIEEKLKVITTGEDETLQELASQVSRAYSRARYLVLKFHLYVVAPHQVVYT
jgi:hypothetical protein